MYFYPSPLFIVQITKILLMTIWNSDWLILVRHNILFNSFNTFAWSCAPSLLRVSCTTVFCKVMIKLENKYLSPHEITRGTYRHTTTRVAFNPTLYVIRNKATKEDFSFSFPTFFPCEGPACRLTHGRCAWRPYGYHTGPWIELPEFLGPGQGHCSVYFCARHLTHVVLLPT